MTTINVLGNGLTVIVDEMPHVQSVGYELRMPGGLVVDSAQSVGASLLLSELTCRGAGDLSSRELSDAFDSIGARHYESAGLDRFVYGGACLGSEFETVLKLVSMMVRTPTLPEGEIESIRSLLLHDIAAVSENPARRASYELIARYFPAPYSRCPVGEREGVAATSRSIVQTLHQQRFSPRDAVLSVAGAVRTDFCG